MQGEILNFEYIWRHGSIQSAPASALIPDKGILTLDNPTLDSPVAHHAGGMAQGYGSPCGASNYSSRGDELYTFGKCTFGHTCKVALLPNLG